MAKRSSCFARSHEALVDQGGKAVEDSDGEVVSVANRLGGLEGEAAGKDTEAAEQGLLVGGEEFVTPGDRTPQRALAGGGVAPAVPEGGEALIEAGGEGGQRQHFDASRGELDGEGEAV